MSSSLFGQINLISRGLEASWLRNQTIANNIANVDTANYKRKDVKFETVLKEAAEAGSLTEDQVKNLTPEVIVDQGSLSYRMDGNNVDIDMEMANRAKNELYFNALTSQINQKFSQISTVLNAK